MEEQADAPRQQCGSVVDVTTDPWYTAMMRSYFNAGNWGCMFRLVSCPSRGLAASLAEIGRQLPARYIAIHVRLAYNVLVGERDFMNRVENSFNSTKGRALNCGSPNSPLSTRVKNLERLLELDTLPDVCKSNMCATVCCRGRVGLSELFEAADSASVDKVLGAQRIFFTADTPGIVNFAQRCLSDRLALVSGNLVHSAKLAESDSGTNKGHFKMLIDMLALSKAAVIYRLTDSTFSTLARFLGPARPGERRSDWVRNYVASRNNGTLTNHRLRPALLAPCAKTENDCGERRFRELRLAPLPNAPPPPFAPGTRPTSSPSPPPHVIEQSIVW